MIAPYIRLISSRALLGGQFLLNYDIRLTQPNKEFIDPSSIHTIEHSLAALVRDRLEEARQIVSRSDSAWLELVDCSPFGCLTGFHAIFLSPEPAADSPGSPSATTALITRVFTDSLLAIVEDFEEADVPAVTELECGNAAMHSLPGAKIWARRILAKGFSTNPYAREVVNV